MWGSHLAHGIGGWVDLGRYPEGWEKKVVRQKIGYREIDQISNYGQDKRNQVSHCIERANKHGKKDNWNDVGLELNISMRIHWFHNIYVHVEININVSCVHVCVYYLPLSAENACEHWLPQHQWLCRAPQSCFLKWLEDVSQNIYSDQFRMLKWQTIFCSLLFLKYS